MRRLRQQSLYPGWGSTSQQPRVSEPVEIDWDHSLANGLIGCYLPTMTIPDLSGNAPSIRDLSKIGTTLICHDGSSNFDLAPIGYCNRGSGEFVGGSGWYAASTTAQQPASNASGFFIGYVFDGGDIGSYPVIIGSTYTNGSSAPFDAFNIRRPGSDGTALSFSWNVGGTNGNVTQTGLLGTGTKLSGGFTLNCNGVAGSARLFANGALVNSGTAASGTISYSSPQMCFSATPAQNARTGMATSIGLVWNRTLSDQEMAWLNAEPYVIFLPAQRRRFVAAPVPGVVELPSPKFGLRSTIDPVLRNLRVGQRAFALAPAPPPPPLSIIPSPPQGLLRSKYNLRVETKVPKPIVLGKIGANTVILPTGIVVSALSRKVLARGTPNVVFDTLQRKAITSGTPNVVFSQLVRSTLVAIPPTAGPIPVFPTLPQGFPVKVDVVMDTTIGTTKSLREVRVAKQQFPLWDIEIKFEELRDQTQNQTHYQPFLGFTQYMQLVQLWLSMYGQANIFAFDCPWDDSRLDQSIGTGDGSTYIYTIVRTWGQAPYATTAPIGMVNTITNVKINGSPITTLHYLIQRNKIYFINTATSLPEPPALGATITMTFSFYYLCRFVADEQEFEEFAKNRYTVPSLKFRAVLWP